MISRSSAMVALLGAFSGASCLAADPLVIWSQKPAADWNEATPIGNGRLGAMVFGDVASEHLQLNDDTLYSGEPGDRDLPLNVAKDLPYVRDLLKEGKYAEAHAYVTDHWLGRAQDCYEPLGDLHLDFSRPGDVSNYRRKLNVADAVVHESYDQAGVTFTRDIFASHPAQAIVIRLHASKDGALNFAVRLDSVHPTAKTEALPQANELSMVGQVPGFALRRSLATVENHKETWKYPEIFDANGQLKPGGKTVLYGEEIGGRGTRFNARVLLQSTDGTVTRTKDSLSVSNAGDAVLILVTGSSFNGFNKSPSRDGKDESAEAIGFLSAAAPQSYDQLRQRHLDDYHALFNRVTLQFDAGAGRSDLPTAERIAQYGQGGDEALAALYYQFGRYLLISGSRPGGQPLNLQGMWSPDVIPPWAGAYTLNINLEMNYWPAESGNLDECTQPLLKLIQELAVNGRKVAHDMYGLPGWVAHHNTTIWRDAEPVDGDAGPAFWNMSGPWLCQHLWTHYLFTGDTAFLRDQAYPVMKGAAEFLSAWLVKNSDGQWVTPVGGSPENRFLYTDSMGKTQSASLIPGPTMDIALTRELFTNCVQASELLGVDEEFRKELEARLALLPPYEIGEGGRLEEWPGDLQGKEAQHRHVSHLYGLFPGDQISVRDTPALAAACAKTLELRGDMSTGWSLAWKINLWAKLHDGDHAHRCLALLLTPERSFPNLFDSCPRQEGGRDVAKGAPPTSVFQIDGVLGATSGIAEMLLQSDQREIELLPALPQTWPSGSFTGLRSVGGYEIDCAWKDGHLASAELRNARASTCHLRYGDKVVTLNFSPGQAIKLNGDLSIAQ
jgi:alpha-L-fucosidase 2